jgi:hypothetical protein
MRSASAGENASSVHLRDGRDDGNNSNVCGIVCKEKNLGRSKKSTLTDVAQKRSRARTASDLIAATVTYLSPGG